VYNEARRYQMKISRREFIKALGAGVAGVAAAAAGIEMGIAAAAEALPELAQAASGMGGYLVPESMHAQLLEGIRRSSPLMLDNLGIRVSKELIEDCAAELDITMQEATLHAVMEAAEYEVGADWAADDGYSCSVMQITPEEAEEADRAYRAELSEAEAAEHYFACEVAKQHKRDGDQEV
jgi:hypothetical protein